MRPLHWIVLSTLLLAVGLLLFNTPIVTATPMVKGGGTISLTPLWIYGELSTGVGRAGLVVEDLDANGVDEVAFCNEHGSLFIVSYQGETYAPEWHSELIDCFALSGGDRDGNGAFELYMVGSPSFSTSPVISIIDGTTHELLDTLSLTGTNAVTGVVALPL